MNLLLDGGEWSTSYLAACPQRRDRAVHRIGGQVDVKAALAIWPRRRKIGPENIVKCVTDYCQKLYILRVPCFQALMPR